MNETTNPLPADMVPSRQTFRWRKYFLQFSLRSLLILTTLAAGLCWWFIQPQARNEQLAGSRLKLRRDVRLAKLGPLKYASLNGSISTSEVTILVNSGRWRLCNSRDDLLAAGRFDNHQPHGNWTTYHPSGNKAAEGEAFHGARRGVWRSWNEAGRLLSEVNYETVAGPLADEVESKVAHSARRAPRGLSHRLFEPGRLDQHKSVRHGPARAWYASGRLKFNGPYQNDRREGNWTYYDSRGRVTAAGQFKNNKREGRWTERDPLSGNNVEVEYVAGRRVLPPDATGR